MADKLSSLAKAFTPSPIQELSHLAQRCNAINLAEGFPDFPAPPHIKNAAVSAINSDFNQYRHVQGICDHLAMMAKKRHGLEVNPLTDIAICCGQSEAFAAAVFAVIDQGDEVIIFEPSYETYEACVRMARGTPVFVALDPPHWTLDPKKLLQSITERTKAVVLNSPQNPTGKVFSKDELETIAEVCRTKDCLAITDEVYEHITFDNQKHISLASLTGMQERTIITSSLSKTFCVTGWRVGWTIAPAFLASAIRNIHVKITDSAPAPFQEAALTALQSPPEYYETLRRDYESKRDYIVKLLAGMGFKIQFKPQGSFFLFAEIPESCPLSDVEYVEELIKQGGVVAVPGCGFFHTNLSLTKFSPEDCSYQKRYIRFAFCKSNATLAAAAQKLGGYFHGRDNLTYGVDVGKIRWLGVLQRIAIGYLLVSMSEIWLVNNMTVDSPAAFVRKYYIQCLYVQNRKYEASSKNLCGYLAGSEIECNVNSPDYGPLPPDSPGWCLAPFDPEGILSSVMASITCFAGMHFDHVLVHFKDHMQRVLLCLMLSFPLLIAGYFFEFLGILFCKPLYTLSYMCITAGASGVFLTIIFYIKLQAQMVNRVDNYKSAVSVSVSVWFLYKNIYDV